jgi:hypothetical protein
LPHRSPWHIHMFLFCSNRVETSSQRAGVCFQSRKGREGCPKSEAVNQIIAKYIMIIMS